MVSTSTRVPSHTAHEVNSRIRNKTEESLAYYAKHPARINARLAALDREWDIERAIEANAATLGLIGVALGAAVHRRWLLLPGAVTAFLLQHAIQGWCPPVPVLRRMGFRTADEIGQERYALKALRGDFKPAARRSGKQAGNNLEAALAAVELRH
jgi:hypothetical protein